MKFHLKISLCVIAVLTAALAFVEYYTVSSAFSNALSQRREAALRQHQLIVYAIRSDLLSLGQNAVPDDRMIEKMALQEQENFSLPLTLTIAKSGESKDELECEFRKTAQGPQLVISGTFIQSGTELTLSTRHDAGEVFASSERLEEQCTRVLLVTAAAGAVAVTLLSFALTRSVVRLDRTSRAFAAGDYSRRVKKAGRDEIGDLTRSFNHMADTIEEKIALLEMTAKKQEDFTAAFAHELKTPLTGIIGYADTLYQREVPPRTVQEYGGYILNEGLRLEALSHKLMELITLDRQKFLLEETDADAFFEDLASTALLAAKKRTVRLRFSVQPGYVMMEPDLCKTLLLNLIDNALKSGGDTVTVTGRVKDGKYRICVADNGRGIPSSELSRITEAFYMVDKSRSRKEHGAGMGLALCERIAQVHGTRLQFQSEEGRGTAVHVSLPLCEGEAEA